MSTPAAFHGPRSNAARHGIVVDEHCADCGLPVAGRFGRPVLRCDICAPANRKARRKATREAQRTLTRDEIAALYNDGKRRLADHERYILESFYALDGRHERTLAEIADDLRSPVGWDVRSYDVERFRDAAVKRMRKAARP